MHLLARCTLAALLVMLSATRSFALDWPRTQAGDDVLANVTTVDADEDGVPDQLGGELDEIIEEIERTNPALAAEIAAARDSGGVVFLSLPPGTSRLGASDLGTIAIVTAQRTVVEQAASVVHEMCHVRDRNSPSQGGPATTPGVTACEEASAWAAQLDFLNSLACVYFADSQPIPISCDHYERLQENQCNAARACRGGGNSCVDPGFSGLPCGACSPP